MRKLLTPFLFFLTLAASAWSPVWSATERYTLDPAHTTVAFLIDHIGYAKTLGYFSDVSGTFAYNTETREVSDISIVVKTASVQSDNEKRDDHVRNKDFLNVKKHPEMVFNVGSAVVDDNGSGTLSGELQLLGQTQPLELAVQVNKSEKYPFGHKRFTLGVSARGSLQRSAYGMDYGVANGLVGDDIELIIETEAIQDK